MLAQPPQTGPSLSRSQLSRRILETNLKPTWIPAGSKSTPYDGFGWLEPVLYRPDDRLGLDATGLDLKPTRSRRTGGTCGTRGGDG